MLIDASGIPDGTSLNADICIVGGGVAGITLALEFEKNGISTCVLEGGGRTFESRSQSLYRAENIGLPYNPQATRARQLGGSSSWWGGWIRPFLPLDFEQRYWVPNSGWPLELADLEPFYPRANDMVQVNHHCFDPKFWVERMHNGKVRLIELDEHWLDTIVSKFSPPTRFGRDYYRPLQAAQSAKVLLHATATGIIVSQDAATVTGVRVATLGGSKLTVHANRTILAAGGIENARLLLLSRDVEECGLGNRHDVVGRYFMEHPRIRRGQFFPSPPSPAVRFYDARYTYHNPDLAVNGTSAAGHISLSERVQREEWLVQCRTYLRSCRLGENGALTDIFHEMCEALIWRNYKEITFSNMLALVLGSPNLLASLLYRKLKLVGKSDYYQLESVIEPVPDRESRVTLSSTRDRLGLQMAQIDWRVGEIERRTHRRALELVKTQVEALEMGSVVLEGTKTACEAHIMGCNHHMGTTRMHIDPRFGVVDPSCRVHGIHNLYVAGSSVFPTCGNDMPTLTIVALALRLADHIKAERSHRQSLPTLKEGCGTAAVRSAPDLS